MQYTVHTINAMGHKWIQCTIISCNTQTIWRVHNTQTIKCSSESQEHSTQTIENAAHSTPQLDAVNTQQLDGVNSPQLDAESSTQQLDAVKSIELDVNNTFQLMSLNQ